MSVSLARPGLRLIVMNNAPLPEWLTRHPRADYIIKVALSCPPWTDRKALNDLQKRARAKSASTGIPHVLDHIVPVTHPYVCGLTVPWNLRIVPKRVNDAKSARWAPDQEELFVEPEQLRLELLGRIGA